MVTGELYFPRHWHQNDHEESLHSDALSALLLTFFVAPASSEAYKLLISLDSRNSELRNNGEQHVHGPSK